MKWNTQIYRTACIYTKWAAELEALFLIIQQSGLGCTRDTKYVYQTWNEPPDSHQEETYRPIHKSPCLFLDLLLLESMKCSETATTML